MSRVRPSAWRLQGVRDNPRRMAALGFNVHGTPGRGLYLRGAAGRGWAASCRRGTSAQISPGTAGIGPVIDILVIAVIGGLQPSDRAVHRGLHLRRALEDLRDSTPCWRWACRGIASSC